MQLSPTRYQTSIQPVWVAFGKLLSIIFFETLYVYRSKSVHSKLNVSKCNVEIRSLIKMNKYLKKSVLGDREVIKIVQLFSNKFKWAIHIVIRSTWVWDLSYWNGCTR